MQFNLFLNARIPDSVPEEMRQWIVKLKKIKSKEACIRKAYDLITKKFRGERIHMKYNEIFISDPKKIWKRKVIFCTTFNWLMKILLIKSKKFMPEDIKIKWSFVWYLSLHQHLQVRVSRNKAVNVDLWGHYHNIKFGDYARGFHKTTPQ